MPDDVDVLTSPYLSKNNGEAVDFEIDNNDNIDNIDDNDDDMNDENDDESEC
jgi:hypothetical protein